MITHMKWMLVISCLVISGAAVAAGTTTAPAVKPLQPPSNVEVINGKRFFSLQNARRFNGPSNSPKALSVIHAPRGGSFSGSPRTHSVPSALPLAPSGDAAAMPKTQSDSVLSIFAPEDKSLSPAAR